ncbi:MAG: hypothetical protein EB145_10875 [Proteobacteria bacterium]|nr:hypothetical protein [Pseudomonadota bacterium]
MGDGVVWRKAYVWRDPNRFRLLLGLQRFRSIGRWFQHITADADVDRWLPVVIDLGRRFSHLRHHHCWHCVLLGRERDGSAW